jgi:hypothetical protein
VAHNFIEFGLTTELVECAPSTCCGWAQPILLRLLVEFECGSSFESSVDVLGLNLLSFNHSSFSVTILDRYSLLVII